MDNDVTVVLSGYMEFAFAVAVRTRGEDYDHRISSQGLCNKSENKKKN